MTTIDDVINYVFHTIGNTNPAILKQLLKQLIEDNRFDPIDGETIIYDGGGVTG